MYCSNIIQKFDFLLMKKGKKLQVIFLLARLPARIRSLNYIPLPYKLVNTYHHKLNQLRFNRNLFPQFDNMLWNIIFSSKLFSIGYLT